MTVSPRLGEYLSPHATSLYYVSFNNINNQYTNSYFKNNLK